MTNTTHLPLQLSWLALLCAWLVVFVWAAPVLAGVSDDSSDFLNQSQDQASEPADVPAEAEDASDDPMMLASIDKAGLLPLSFALRSSHLTEQAWSPASPVRPPDNLNSI